MEHPRLIVQEFFRTPTPDDRRRALEQLAEATNARVFDGREDLIDAFRKVKGYN